MVLSESHAGGRLAHACGSNPLTFPTHGLGRVGIYRLPTTGWEPPQVGAVPHNMWRASGGKDGPVGPSTAASGSCLPSLHGLLRPPRGPMRRFAEALLLVRSRRRSGCCVPPHMHVSPPCSPPSAGQFRHLQALEPMAARRCCCWTGMLTAAGVLPKVLLHRVSSCAVPPAAPALRWSVCPLPCCVRAVLPAACAASLAASMRCVLARDALAYLSRLPPALVAPAAAALHSASPSSASSASSASSVSLPAAASIASLPR